MATPRGEEELLDWLTEARQESDVSPEVIKKSTKRMKRVRTKKAGAKKKAVKKKTWKKKKPAATKPVEEEADPFELLSSDFTLVSEEKLP